MIRLHEGAKADLLDAGVTPELWARANGSPDGTWHGCCCGCPLPNCCDGTHHDPAEACPCLPVLLAGFLESRNLPAGARHPCAPAGTDVPARSRGAARAPEFSAGNHPSIPRGPAESTYPGGDPPSPPGADGALEGSPRTLARPALEAAEPSRLPGPSPARAPVRAGEAAPAPDGPRPQGSGAALDPPEAPRVSAGASGGATPDAMAAWKRALADKAKAQRNKRGKQRAQQGYRPGMTRRPPGGDAA